MACTEVKPAAMFVNHIHAKILHTYLMLSESWKWFTRKGIGDVTCKLCYRL